MLMFLNGTREKFSVAVRGFYHPPSFSRCRENPGRSTIDQLLIILLIVFDAGFRPKLINLLIVEAWKLAKVDQ